MKKMISVTCLVCSILLLLGCRYSRESNENVEIKKYYLNEFWIEGGLVYFECEIELYNSLNRPIELLLHGDFTEDRQLGLLTEGELVAKNKEDGSTIFRVENNTSSFFQILFVGTFAGNPTKKNRNPPQIVIQEISERNEENPINNRISGVNGNDHHGDG